IFIAMEYVEGETLQMLARRELMPLRSVVDFANELAQALEEAHSRGIIHRDVKPSNVMVTRHGHVKVMDFGLAKRTGAAGVSDHSSGVQLSTTLSGAGMRFGTPAYMSPEQIVDDVLDARSDLFPLGVVLYELTTGVHPFLRNNVEATTSAILQEPPAPGVRD